MKPIVRQLFVADDGTEFLNEADALKHDYLCKRVKLALTPFGDLPKDDGCAFGNGHGFLGHGPFVVSNVRYALLLIAKDCTDHRWIDDALKDPNVHSSYPGRILSELGGPLYSAWHRIMCCDSQGREWGQPYFASHPDEGEQRDIKKRA